METHQLYTDWRDTRACEYDLLSIIIWPYRNCLLLIVKII